jgi:Biotin carboxyl carrier protein
VKKQKPSKSKKGGTPIILPQAFAAPQRGQGAGSLSGQQTRHIQELIDLLKKNNLTELELEREGLRIRVRNEVDVNATATTVADRGTPGSTAVTPAPTANGAKTEHTTGMITIVSPIVGTFYRSPSPMPTPMLKKAIIKKGTGPVHRRSDEVDERNRVGGQWTGHQNSGRKHQACGIWPGALPC